MSDSKISSDVAFKLRLELDSGRNADGNPLLVQLHKFRKEYQDIIKVKVAANAKEDQRIERVSRVFFELWNYLAQLHESNEYEKCRLPPIYSSGSLNRLLSTFIPELLLREEGQFSDGGTFVLGGLMGSGKTTIMKAILLATNICSTNLLFICHDFQKEHSLPTELGTSTWRELNDNLHEKKSLRDLRKLDIFEQIKKDFNVTLCIMLDEIQRLFTNGSSKRDILIAYSSYVKDSRYILFLTGSACDLHYRLIEVDGSLFKHSKYHQIEPLRNIAVLRDYMKARYSLELTASEYSSLLFYTGGIGRAIHDLFGTKSLTTKIEDATYGDIRSAKERILSKYPTEAFAIIAEMDRLNVNCIESILNPEAVQEIPGVERTVLSSSFTPIMRRSRNIFIHLTELGLLYINDATTGNTVHFAVPAVIALMLNQIDIQDLRRIALSLMMIYSNKIELNAGKAFEMFLRPKLHLATGGELKPWTHECVMKLTPTEISFTGKNKAISTQLPFNELIAWKYETGVDGIQFFLSDESVVTSAKAPQPAKKIVFVDFWQWKSGYCNQEIGGGTLTTYQTKYCKDKNVGRFKTDQMNGILVNAEVGMLQCLRDLSHHCGAQYDFRIRHLFLTVTSRVSKSGQDLMDHIMITIPESLVKTVFALSRPARSTLPVSNPASKTSPPVTSSDTVYSYTVKFYGLPLEWLEQSVKGTPLYDFVLNAAKYFVCKTDNPRANEDANVTFFF
jgi:hypothetical protein